MMDEVAWEQLRVAASAARENAYAPYSGFLVGAAVRTDAGVVYVGANVENASYGATICAERIALGAAIAAGERHFSALAIVTGASAPTPPCGICRQWLSELAPNIPIRSFNGAEHTDYTVSELLPHAFGASELE